MGKDSDHDRAEWTMTDAWVFAAIANDRPPTPHSLIEVIAIADGINHDVLTEDQFSRAIGHLLGAELIGVDVDADRYWPTRAGAAIRARWRHGLFGWIDSIPSQLQRLGEPEDSDWSLPHGTFDRAMRGYLARWPGRA